MNSFVYSQKPVHSLTEITKIFSTGIMLVISWREKSDLLKKKTLCFVFCFTNKNWRNNIIP